MSHSDKKIGLVVFVGLLTATSSTRAADPPASTPGGSVPGAEKQSAPPEKAVPRARPGAARTPRPGPRPAESPGIKAGPTVPPAARPKAGPETIPPPPAPRATRPADARGKPRLFAPGSGIEAPPGSKGPEGIIPFVGTTYGSAKLLTLLQARLNVPLRGAQSTWQTYRGRYVAGGANTEQNVAFMADRIRLILTGHFLTKNLTYMFQGDAVQQPFLLDVKFTYSLPWVKGLSITFGRFLSVYSLIMSRLISRLETTEYPIFLAEGGYAPWRDFGVQIKYTVPAGGAGSINAYVGIFNGEVNSWHDTNDMKDFLFRVDFLGKGMLKGLWAGGYAWLGFPSCRPYDPADPATQATATCAMEDFERKGFDTDLRAGVFVEWEREFGFTRPHVMLEGYFRKYTPKAENGAERWDITGGGLWTHVGVRLGKYVEPMARFEYLKTTNQADSDAKDHALRVSAGAQVYFHRIHSHLKINYLYQWMGADYSGTSQWTEVDKSDLAAPLAPESTFHMFVVQAVTEF